MLRVTSQLRIDIGTSEKILLEPVDRYSGDEPTLFSVKYVRPHLLQPKARRGKCVRTEIAMDNVHLGRLDLLTSMKLTSTFIYCSTSTAFAALIRAKVPGSM